MVTRAERKRIWCEGIVPKHNGYSETANHTLVEVLYGYSVCVGVHGDDTPCLGAIYIDS